MALEGTYYDPSDPGSFGGLQRLYASAKGKDKKLTRKKVMEWAPTQDTYTLHFPGRKRFPRSRILVRRVDDLWQIDLADMSSLSASNDNIRYIYAYSEF